MQQQGIRTAHDKTRSLSAVSVLLTIMPLSASAQIMTDGSLGSAIPEALTPAANETITIPADRGSTVCNTANTSCHVFHSFSKFNINAGQTATFTGPVNIDPGAVKNVFARVTGQSLSNIDGSLRTTAMPNANFFLINPNGVVFGPEAQLDVGGSFVVTTADELRMTDQSVFAIPPDSDTDVLLTTAAPSKFGFLTTNAGSPEAVEVNGGSLEVGRGHALTVVAGDVHLQNGTIHTVDGQANIIAVGSASEVDLDPTGVHPKIDMDSLGQLGEVSLTQESHISSSGSAPGSVVVGASNVRIEKSSIAISTTEDTHTGSGSLTDIKAQKGLHLTAGGQIISHIDDGDSGGDIRIVAQELSLSGDPLSASQTAKTGILSTVETDPDGTTGMSGTGGSIWIETQALRMNHHAGIEATALNSSTSGNVRIDADSISMSGRTTIAASTSGTGDGGSVTIVADDIHLSEASTIATLSLQSEGGTTGDLTIDAGEIDLVGLEGSNKVFSEDLTGFLSRTGIDASDGGDIRVTATSLKIADRAVINASTRSSGPSGKVQISGRDGPRSLDLIVENGGVISSNTLSIAGSGGVKIDADTVRIVGVHRLLLNTGDITTTPVPFYSPSLVGTISFEGGGDAGDVNLEANELTIHNGGLLTAFTEGDGDGGDLKVTADRVFLSGFSPGQRQLFEGLGFDPGRASSSITTTTGGFLGGAGSTGRAGDIEVTAPRIELVDHGRIASASTTIGDAGRIELNADRVLIQNNGIVSAASTRGTGGAGRIVINAADRVELSHQGIIQTSSQFANAGGITLKVDPAGESILLADSTISAAAAVDGGDIKLTAPRRVQLINSTLTAQAGQNGASIDIASQFLILQNSVINGLSGGDPVFVTIDPNAVFLNSNSQILTAAASLPPELDISGSLIIFSVSLIESLAQLQPGCAARFANDVSSFTVERPRGAPLRPDGWLPSFTLIESDKTQHRMSRIDP